MTVGRRARVSALLGPCLCIGYVVTLLWTAPSLGISRDESFYAQAARSYGGWLETLWTDPGSALSRETIDRAWRYNWEHPPLMKLAFSVAWLAHQKLGLFSSPSLAVRFPTMMTAGLLVWLIYAWGAAAIGAHAGLFAALTFATFPRVFYHSHLAAFDVPIAFFFTLTAYCYWRALSDARWSVVCGLAFGLALATKHNSWMLPGVLGVHYLWVRWSYARAGAPERPKIGWLPAMLLLGPILTVATWPWLWHDGWQRLSRYVAFHLRHVHYSYEYLGVTYFEPPLPISVPFVMTLFTVPLIVLVLAGVGIAFRRSCFAPPWAIERGAPANTNPDLLWLGCLVAPLLAIAIPTTPIFGGTKHWLPAYPFLALFAARGLRRAIEGLPAVRPRLDVASMIAFTGICLAPGVVETAHSHPFGLSHYTPVAGGVPGAADLGMNRQFWGFTTASLVSWLVERLPEGGSVWPGDTTWGAWHMLQAEGKLPQNIRPVRSMTEADYVLVHHETHFNEVDYQAWVAFGTVRPVHVLQYDGVPIISVYENPARARPR